MQVSEFNISEQEIEMILEGLDSLEEND